MEMAIALAAIETEWPMLLWGKRTAILLHPLLLWMMHRFYIFTEQMFFSLGLCNSTEYDGGSGALFSAVEERECLLFRRIVIFTF